MAVIIKNREKVNCRTISDLRSVSLENIFVPERFLRTRIGVNEERKNAGEMPAMIPVMMLNAKKSKYVLKFSSNRMDTSWATFSWLNAFIRYWCMITASSNEIIENKTDSLKNWITSWPRTAPITFLMPTSLALVTALAIDKFV